MWLRLGDPIINQNWNFLYAKPPIGLTRKLFWLICLPIGRQD